MAISFVTASNYIGSDQRVNFPADPSASTRRINATIGAYSYNATLTANATTHDIPVPSTVINQISGNVSGTLRVTITGTTAQTGLKTLYVPTTPITTLDATVDFGGTQTVTFTPPATSLKYATRYIFGPLTVWAHGSAYIEPGSTTPYTDSGTIPLNWAPYLWDAESTEINIELVTYTSTNKEVGRVMRTVTASVPAYTPTYTKTISEGTTSGFSLYVQSLSTVQAVVTGFTSSYNGQGLVYVSTVSLTVDGVTYTKTGQYNNASTVTINSKKLKTYGTVPATLTITDTRGRTATETVNLTVIQYWTPAITEILPEVSGNTVNVTITGTIAPVNNLNDKLITIIRKNTKTAVETTIVEDAVLSDYEFTYTFTETIADVDVTSYEYIVTITDSVTSSTQSRSTGVICISRLAGGLGVRFFAEAEEEGLWIRDVEYDISDTEYDAVIAAVATPYNTAETYNAGAAVYRSSHYYECISNGTTGAWDADKWRQII